MKEFSGTSHPSILILSTCRPKLKAVEHGIVSNSLLLLLVRHLLLVAMHLFLVANIVFTFYILAESFFGT